MPGTPPNSNAGGKIDAQGRSKTSSKDCPVENRVIQARNHDSPLTEQMEALRTDSQLKVNQGNTRWLTRKERQTSLNERDEPGKEFGAPRRWKNPTLKKQGLETGGPRSGSK